MTEKRFQYNVNKNTIEQDGKFVAYMNSVDGVRIANKLNVLQNENEQLKKELHKLKVVNEMLSIDFSNSEHELWRENEQLKERIKELEKEVNNLSCGEADWLIEEEL